MLPLNGGAAVIRCVFLLLFVALAGCATPSGNRSAGGGDVHYKVGNPYRINGKWYRPREDSNYEAIGTASWYGDAFHGRATANGEVFDKGRLSAAHTTLPLPSLVEVENLENGRRVVVRVNDRGPFVDDRLIDLSESAAKALAFDKKGLARVRVRYLGRAELAALAPKYGERVLPATVTPPIAVAVRSAPPPNERESARLVMTPVTSSGDLSAAPLTMAPVGGELAMAPVSSSGDDMAAFIEDALNAPPEALAPAEYWISVAEYSTLGDLEAARLTLQSFGDLRVISEIGPGGAPAYGLQIGPFLDAPAAEARLAALREAGYSDASIDGDSCAAAPQAYAC